MVIQKKVGVKPNLRPEDKRKELFTYHEILPPSGQSETCIPVSVNHQRAA